MGNQIVVIGDKDGGRVVELDDSSKLPVNSFSRSATVLLRHGAAGTGYFLNVNDDALPVLGSGVDISQYARVGIACRVSGDGASWDIVPIYGDAVAGAYVSGDKIDIDGEILKTLESVGSSDFYVLCRNKVGADAGIKVYVAGYSS